jgi:pyridoxine/pyridoxamine 5'-phosphate oxidase
MPDYGVLDAPGGAGLLPWHWAARRLADSHNYLLTTVRPDGRPHSAPVWGIWFEDAFCFSTGPRSRKARNLAANSHCVVCPEGLDQAVILEGVAEPITDRARLRRLFEVYNAKYQWDSSPDLGPVYAVRPTVAFGFIEYALQGSATRWRFPARNGAKRK